MFSFERHFAPTLSTSIAHTTAGWMPVESVVRYGREIPTIFYCYGMLLLRWFLNGRGFLKSRKIWEELKREDGCCKESQEKNLINWTFFMKEEKLFSRLVGFCAILYAFYLCNPFSWSVQIPQDSHSLTKISSTSVQCNITGVMKNPRRKVLHCLISLATFWSSLAENKS